VNKEIDVLALAKQGLLSASHRLDSSDKQLRLLAKEEVDKILGLIELYASPQPVAFEDALEAAYWEFDARVKGYDKWKLNKQSERDAFKWSVRGIYAAPVQPVKQEPVAWLRKDHTKTMSNEDKLSWIAAGHTDITDEYTIPLYTTAPSDLGEPIAYLFTDIQSGDTEASCDPYWKTSPYWISEPLYTTPPSVEAAIAETKEKAAKVCENITDADAFTLNKCAAAIRSMK